jgi:hypothetical protein|tara:strand:+ start:94 stop:309 length:216 start_codon:yes stop_codon:yes gene_type:complete
MKLESWLEMEDLDPKGNYDHYTIEVDTTASGLTVISHCGDCKHWSDDLNFCQIRKEINWAKDDGCIKWESL